MIGIGILAIILLASFSSSMMVIPNKAEASKCPPGYTSNDFYKHGQCYKQLVLNSTRNPTSIYGDTNQTRVKQGQQFIKECNAELSQGLPDYLKRKPMVSIIHEFG
jgi:hypothetical protein